MLVGGDGQVDLQIASAEVQVHAVIAGRLAAAHPLRGAQGWRERNKALGRIGGNSTGALSLTVFDHSAAQEIGVEPIGQGNGSRRYVGLVAGSDQLGFERIGVTAPFASSRRSLDIGRSVHVST